MKREVLTQESDYTRKMDGQLYNEPNSTNYININDSVKKQFQLDMRIFVIISIVLLR